MRLDSPPSLHLTALQQQRWVPYRLQRELPQHLTLKPLLRLVSKAHFRQLRRWLLQRESFSVASTLGKSIVLRRLGKAAQQLLTMLSPAPRMLQSHLPTL